MRGKYKDTMTRYNRSVLRYRENRLQSRQSLSAATRVAIIYDNLIHKKQILELIGKYSMNYSTIRHLLLQYYLCGKTDMRKFK